MNYFKTKDGTSLYYKDWGKGQPIVFSHGWPLCSDAWEDQMMFLSGKGFRTVAHDRRGHGRSDQPWDGNDIDTYADDLAQVIEMLNLKDIVLVGHSTGGGEITRYIGRHGGKRVAGVVLISAITPGMLKTSKNPGGVPMQIFDGIREELAKDRSQFFQDFSAPFYGANRSGSKVSQGTRDTFWMQGMQSGLKGEYDCVKAFSESEFTEDLKKFDMPTLIIHGEDDQVVPIDNSARRVEKLVKGSILKTYPNGCHGLPAVFKDKVNEDIFSFIKESVTKTLRKSA